MTKLNLKISRFMQRVKIVSDNHVLLLATNELLVAEREKNLFSMKFKYNLVPAIKNQSFSKLRFARLVVCTLKIA